jgi:acyl-CoA synthetase (AMP-forming)/AMP-acid ligase II
VGDWTEATTIGSALVRSSQMGPANIALVLPPDRVTNQELHERVVLLSRGLFELGVRSNVRVGLLMPNSLEMVEMLLAVAYLGAISVPINTRYQLTELTYIIEHAELALVVTMDGGPEKVDFVDLLRRCASADLDPDQPPELRNFPALRHLVVLQAEPASGFVDTKDLFRRGATVPRDAVDELCASVRPEDPAMILYTSGTTSKPKGCVLSHEAIVRTGIARLAERSNGEDALVLWTPCPLFHVGALVPLIGCLALGGTYITTRGFDPKEALQLLSNERVSIALPLFPAFTDAIMDLPEFQAADLGPLVQILTTGPPKNVERAQAAFAPTKLISGYGMTEVCGVAASSPLDESDADRLIWDGVPFQGIDMRVVHPDTGLELPFGSLGEIVVRGYCVFDGYYRDAEASASAFDRDGWFHTGDMGLMDEAGRIAFRGRYKDILKVGGENVSALEVEAFIGRHPCVRHVEVVGAPDERLDEVVSAFIESVPGSLVTSEEIVEFCRGHIAKFKIPKYVEFLDAGDWPTSATKIDKVALRDMMKARLSGPPSLTGPAG